MTKKRIGGDDGMEQDEDNEDDVRSDDSNDEDVADRTWRFDDKNDKIVGKYLV